MEPGTVAHIFYIFETLFGYSQNPLYQMPSNIQLNHNQLIINLETAEYEKQKDFFDYLDQKILAIENDVKGIKISHISDKHSYTILL